MKFISLFPLCEVFSIHRLFVLSSSYFLSLISFLSPNPEVTCLCVKHWFYKALSPSLSLTSSISMLSQVNNFQLSTRSHLYGDHFTKTDRILGSLGILQLYLLLSMMESSNVVLTFEYMDEILK